MRNHTSSIGAFTRIACLVAVLYSVALPRANAQLTIEIKDYVTMPITGLVDGKGSNDGLLARVNTLREEPGGANRLFITDLNGPVSILDKDPRNSQPISTSTAVKGHKSRRARILEVENLMQMSQVLKSSKSTCSAV